jgi:hypothetical protein
MTITPRPIRRLLAVVQRTLAEGADIAINGRSVPSLRQYPYGDRRR